MGARPPAAVVAAIENGVSQVTRRIAAYESDGDTLWNPAPLDDPGFSRLIDGTVTLDYGSDERRKLDLTMLNSDGLLRLNPRGGFYYDKIVKVFRGVRYSPKLTAPPVALVEFDGTFMEYVALTRQINSMGYDLVDMRDRTEVVDFTNFTTVMAVTYTSVMTKKTLVRELFRNGTNVISVGTYNTAVEIPYVTSTAVADATTTWGLAPSGVDNPVGSNIPSSTPVGLARAGTRITALSVWGQAVSVWPAKPSNTHITASIGSNSKSASWLDLHVPTTVNSVVEYILQRGLDYMRRKQGGYLTWEYQLGEFMIDGMDDQIFPSQVKITGRDYTKKLLTDKLDYATTYRSGTTLKSLLVDVAANGGITKFRVAVKDEVLPTDVSYDRGTDRWQILKNAATSFGYEIFFDNEGYMVVRSYLDPYSSIVAHTFLTGQVGNLIDYSRSVNDQQIFNIVNVYGDPADQNSGQLPYFGQAINDDPNSPTSTVRIGKRSTSFASVFFTSNEQCVATARKLLAVSALESYSANFSSLYYPWLEVGEIAEIFDPNAIATDPTRFLMDTLSLPLGLAPMTGTAKRVTVVGTAGTPATPTVPEVTVPAMARLTKTSDGMIQADGKNFRSGGINAFQLITNDYPQSRIMSHANIDSLLEKAVLLNIGVIRAHTLAASVENAATLVQGTIGDGTAVTLEYDDKVWDAIDYAVLKARQLGIYLIAPFVDELGYYHGGKRQWVNFRHPGSVSLDYSVKAANSSAQRQAENVFYTDAQIQLDFQKFISDWLNHYNPYTKTAYKDEPVLSIVQVGNELWTAAQDAPGWIAGKAAYIKSVAPRTLVMDSGTDGLAVETMAWNSPYIDILETHPYTEFTAEDVRQQSVFAASKKKAFAVGEYAWSKATASEIEAVVRAQGNIFFSAPWSLQNDEDLHNSGAAYGGDDNSLYYPGKDSTQTTVVARLQSHGAAMRSSAASATPPAVPAQGADDFTAANSTPWSTDRWRVSIPRAASGQPAFGNDAYIVNNKGRLHTAALGGYDGNAYVIAVSRAEPVANQRVTFTMSPEVAAREMYFRLAIRSETFSDQIARKNCYFIQVGAGTDGSAYVTPGKMVNGVETFLRSGGLAMPGWTSGGTVAVDFSAIGTSLELKLNGSSVWTGTDSSITAAGYNGFELRGGSAAVSVNLDLDTYRLTAS